MSDDKIHESSDTQPSHGKDTKPDRKRVKKKRHSLSVGGAVSETVSIIAEGQVLAERYRIVEQIGVGGMGMVYKVEDEKLDNRVFALKALPPDMAKSAAAIKRLKKEALAAIDLHHPNIMALHSFDNDGDHYFLVMELLDGPDLEDSLADKDKFTSDEVLGIARHVCPALDHAHKMGVVHRDIKPGNLLYTKQGGEQVVKLADFGIAYQVRDSIARITGQDTTGGTMHYMPPEQLAGRNTDARSDQYALAATLYELLRGRTPFQGAGGVLIHQIQSEQAEAIEDVPEHMNSAILKALSKAPEERFNSCSEFLEALEGKLTVAQASAAVQSAGQGSSKLLPLIMLVLLIGSAFGAHHFGLFGNAQVKTPGEAIPSPSIEPKVTQEPTQLAVVPPTAKVPTPSKKPVEATSTAKTFSGKIYLATVPTGARVFLDGKDTGKTTNTLLKNLTLGKHRLQFKLDSYRTSEEQIVDINSEELQRPSAFMLTPNWGSLAVKGKPSNATFRLIPIDSDKAPNRTYTIGTTAKDLPAGRYLLEAKAPLHALFTKEVTVPYGEKLETVALQLNRKKATLELASIPAGANVWIDGQKMAGRTPLKLRLDCGDRKLRLEKGSWFFDETFYLGTKGLYKSIQLRKLGVSVPIASIPSGANVNVNNAKGYKVFEGKTPCSTKLKPGSYTVHFTKVGYQYKVVKLTVYENSASEVKPKLVEKMGWITVKVSPAGASVKIGQWPLPAHKRTRLQRKPGNYSFSATKSGYKKAQQSVVLRSGEHKIVDFKLTPALGTSDMQVMAKAEAGDAIAQGKVGAMYRDGKGVAKNYKEAVKWFRKSADQGDAFSQVDLGYMYERGKGVKQDLKEAVKWYRKGANQGQKTGQCNLGIMYKNGWGVTKNHREALKWLRRAAEKGQSNAEANLGDMYRLGLGVAMNYQEAIKWYRKAAAQRSVLAECNLGYMYDAGKGVPKNYREAVRFYKRAAEQGYAVAQCNLGIKYEHGQGVPTDYNQALKWYRMSAQQGNASAKKRALALEKYLLEQKAKQKSR